MKSEKPLIHDGAMSYQNTLVLRFVMLAAILVFHGGQYFHFSFPDCGHLCVALFFFMSGYGLELSRNTKPHYMRDFMQKRVLGLMVQYWLILMIIALVVMFMQFDFELLYSNISNAFLRNPWWYITELVVFYVIYYLSMMIGNKALRYAWIFVADSILMLLMTDYFGMDVYLKSGLCFIFGIIWYEFRVSFERVIRRWYPLVLTVSILLMLPAMRNSNDLVDMMLCGITGISMTVVFICMCSLDARRAFPVHILVAIVGLVLTSWMMENAYRSEGAFMLFLAGISGLVVQCSPAKPVLVFLGAASLEMYLMQFMFFQVPDLDATLPDWAATVVAFILMLVVSLPTHEICKRVMKRYSEKIDSFNDG